MKSEDWAAGWGLLLIAMAMVMAVGGIWSDIRWLLTAPVPFAVGACCISFGIFLMDEREKGGKNENR